jgi:Ca-activated chloride channel homolog
MDRKVLILLSMLSAGNLIAQEEAPRVSLSTARTNAQGNEKLAEGLFEEAADLYRSESLRLPENGILQRNLAGALARAGLGEEALASYGQALRFAEGRQEQSKVFFDLANTLALGGQFEPALEQYTRALMLTPEDMDIKHNIEFLQRMMQESEQEQDKGENENENQDQEQEQNQNQDQDQKEQQDQEQQDQNEGEQQQQDGEQEQELEPELEQEQAMSEEDAQRLLDAMMEEEREFQEMRARQEIDEKNNVEKDW